MTVPLNFKVHGSGDPVIILHGFLGSLDNWQTFARQLAKSHMVFTVDLRNHGKSPHQDLFTYDIMVEDLREFMEAEWIYSAHMIGHSMGGKTAMHFANSHPDLVEKLIVVDIAPKAYKRGHDVILHALNQVAIDQMVSRKDAEAVLAKFIDDRGVRAFLLKNLQRNEKGFDWKMNLKSLTSNYDQILLPIAVDKYEKPTQFIRGEHSNYILDDDFPIIQESFLDSELITIPNAGHWVHADQPEAMLKAVHNFIALP